MKVHPPTIPPLCMIFRIAWNCPDKMPERCHFFSWASKILAGKCVSIPHRFLLRHIFCHWHQPLPRFLHINSVVEYLEDGPHKSKLPGLARRWSSHTQKQASPLSHTKATHYLSTNTKRKLFVLPIRSIPYQARNTSAEAYLSTWCLQRGMGHLKNALCAKPSVHCPRSVYSETGTKDGCTYVNHLVLINGSHQYAA